ncbi:MAG: cardiolipin synthase [Lachnospiraceae bacterium]|nr:cardiolipin synthase [Lachnospiraceae bacterium]
MAKKHVIKQGQKRGDRTLFVEKLLWVAILIILQLCFLIFSFIYLREQYIHIQTLFSIISLVLIVYLVNRPINPSYKLVWCITIATVPVFGALLYLILYVNDTRFRFRRSIRKSVEESKTHLTQDESIMLALEDTMEDSTPQARYIYNLAKYPVYQNTSVTYFSSGEEYYIRLLEELEKAEHFIFIEFFIIHEGIFWNSVLDILREKVRNGVEVKILYDDMGSVRTLPPMYFEELRKFGIECYCFNPFSPTLSLRLNNRDHRKIVVIDGHTSFTGGINLADEYINKWQKLNGYWKDTGIMLKGEATWNFSVMFLQLWQHATETSVDYEQYQLSPEEFPAECKANADGYVQPYADNPLYSEIVAENVYLNMIHRATKYIFITTPYLIVDNEMITSLTLAAQSGVDVRILTPGVPDKKAVFMITRSFYEPLTKAGVKIYEYTPGFIHSKMMIADGEYAVVGSINLDYRSLYLHFECAAFLYHCKEIEEIKEDILECLEVSKEITYESCLQLNKPYRLWQSLLRLYAPLL